MKIYAKFRYRHKSHSQRRWINHKMYEQLTIFFSCFHYHINHLHQVNHHGADSPFHTHPAFNKYQNHSIGLGKWTINRTHLSEVLWGQCIQQLPFGTSSVPLDMLKTIHWGGRSWRCLSWGMPNSYSLAENRYAFWFWILNFKSISKCSKT